MQIFRQILMVVALLVAAWAMGATMHKPAPVAAAHLETATLADGCFWGLQESLRQIPGVIKTTVGYTGGTTTNPIFEAVAGGKTGHKEAVVVIFDPAKLSYAALLVDFLAGRNPEHRSTNSMHHLIIFYHDQAQRLAAERVKNQINWPGNWPGPMIAEISPATPFYPAEEYHQDYYQKTAAARTCSLQ